LFKDFEGEISCTLIMNTEEFTVLILLIMNNLKSGPTISTLDILSNTRFVQITKSSRDLVWVTYLEENAIHYFHILFSNEEKETGWIEVVYFSYSAFM
jgi:hypothetical protein